jgi:hypothetical protein
MRLYVYPVDKIVQGVWKSFCTPLPVLYEFITLYFSKSYGVHKLWARSPSLSRNGSLALLQGEFSPLFPHKVSKSLLSLYFSETFPSQPPDPALRTLTLAKSMGNFYAL